MCEDPNDASGFEEEALSLLDQACADDGSSWFSGILSGDQDEDWYQYSVNQGMGSCQGVFHTYESIEPLRLCAYVQCDDLAEAIVTCQGKSQQIGSPLGRVGCCDNEGEGFVWFKFDCLRTVEDALILIRIDNPERSACVDYGVTYNFQAQ